MTTATATSPATQEVETIPGVGTSEAARNLAQISKKAEQKRVDLNDIFFHRNFNVREDSGYTGQDFDDFRESIKRTGGITTPVTLSYFPEVSEKTGNKHFCCVSGFRRLTALAELAKDDPEFAKQIPALIVAPGSKAGFKTLQLLENLHRKGLNVMEKARGCKEILADAHSGLTQSEVAGMLALNESQVSQYIKFLDFPVEIQNDIGDGSISMSAAREMLYIVPANRWMDCRKIAKELPFGQFLAKIKELYGVKPAAEDEAEPVAGAAAGTSTQKPPVLMRAGALKDTLVPYLAKRVKEVDSEKKVFTAKDLEEAKLDAIQTVLQVPNTKLAAEVKPFEDAQKAEAEKLKAGEESVKAKEKFFHDRYKAVKNLVNAKVDLANPVKITPAECYARVNAEVQELGKDPEKVKALGFVLNFETFLQDLGTYSAETAKTEKAASDKRQAAKVAAEAKAKADKEAADKAAADALAQAATGSATATADATAPEAAVAG